MSTFLFPVASPRWSRRADARASSRRLLRIWVAADVRRLIFPAPHPNEIQRACLKTILGDFAAGQRTWLRCSSVTYLVQYAPSSRLANRTAALAISRSSYFLNRL